MKRILIFLILLFFSDQNIISLDVDKNDIKVKEPEISSDHCSQLLGSKDLEGTAGVVIDGSEIKVQELNQEDFDLDNLLNDLAEENEKLSFSDRFKQKLKLYWENKDIIKDAAKKSIIEHKKKCIAATISLITAITAIYIKKSSIKNHIEKHKKKYLMSALVLILGSVSGVYLLKELSLEVS